MHIDHEQFRILLWFVNYALVLLCFGFILYRRAWRTHPAFAWYLGVVCVKTLVMMYVYFRQPNDYLAAYCVSDVIETALTMLIVREIYNDVFRPYDAIPRETGSVIAGLVLVVSLLITLYLSRGVLTGDSPVVAFFYSLDTVVNVAVVAAFLFVTFFAALFGLSWNPRTRAITYGCLINWGGQLIRIVLLWASPWSPSTQDAIGIAGSLPFVVCAAIWLSHFTRPDRPRPEPTLEQLRRLSHLKDSMNSILTPLRTVRTRFSGSR